MKNRILAIISAIALAILPACSNGSGNTDADYSEIMGPEQMLTVRNRNNGKTLSIGDTAADVKRVTGGKEFNIGDFELDRVHRAAFENAEGLYVDTFEDQVVGLRLTTTTGDLEDYWEILNGVRLGLDKDEVWPLYRDDQYVEEGMKGGVLLSFDQDLNPIPFDQNSYYLINISFDEMDKVEYVGIHTRIAEMTLRERGEYVEEDDIVWDDADPADPQEDQQV